jgi:hypothetical protein
MGCIGCMPMPMGCIGCIGPIIGRCCCMNGGGSICGMTNRGCICIWGGSGGSGGGRCCFLNCGAGSIVVGSSRLLTNGT